MLQWILCLLGFHKLCDNFFILNGEEYHYDSCNHCGKEWGYK